MMVPALCQNGPAARAPRFPAHLGAQYASGRLELRTQVFDVSTSGVFVAAEAQDPPGTEARLRLRTHLTNKPVDLCCRVARAGDRPRLGMGLAFVDPPPEARFTLERYCSLFTDAPRVVMVDDEPGILRVTGRFFERERCSFIGIDQPIHTEQTLRRLEPDAIILDIMMPTVSGIEVAQKLRANPETREIPIIFHSASLPDVLPDDLGDLPFVQKGGSYAEIVRVVREIVARPDRSP